MVQEQTYSKYDYLIVFLLLCFSGNPLLISSGSYKYNYIICMLFMCSICIKRGQSWILWKFFTYFSPYILLFLIQMVLILNVQVSSISLFIIKNIIGCTALMLLGKRFEVPYVNVMFWLSIISLIGFAYNMMTGNVLGTPLPYGRYSILLYSQIVGYEGFIGRNSGMFWEPGAFQGYIIIAIVLLLFNNEIKNKRIMFLFLVAALITTYSTTGYSVLGVIIVFMILHNQKFSSPMKLILIVTLSIAFSYLYYGLDFLHDKIEWETTATAEKEQGRLLDYQFFAEQFKHNFVFGTSFVDMHSGNGFLSHILCMGVLGAGYYYVLLYRCLRKSLSRKDVLFFMLVLILCLQGEGFLDYPLFLALPFLNLNKTTCRYTLAQA